MVRSVSCLPGCLFAAHSSSFSILTATEYQETVSIHKLKMCQAVVMDRLMDVVTV